MGTVDVIARGREVVERAVAAHGGLVRWRARETLRFRYRERWAAPFRHLGQNPWPRAEVSGEMTLWLHRARAEVRLDNAPGVTWRVDDGELTPAGPDSGDLGYALARTHHLTLLPFKLLDPGVHHTWLGTRVVGGRTHDEVLVTFAPGVGRTPRDRYWVLFDVETGRLVQLFLTVTAYHALAFGDVVYEGWREADGILTPTRVRAYYPVLGLRVPLHVGEYQEASWR